MTSLRKNYYFSSFFWSTVSKFLSAILGFITVPLLLGYFGKAEYGLLSIATACNGYMHLMDLGMNTGAVKFFSQWSAEGDKERIHRVARTNITFYIFISIINIIGLMALAFWGEGLFSVTHDQFLQLRICFFILAFFSTISWVTTAFNQLLVSDKQIAFTMQIQSLLTVLKLALVAVTIWCGLSLSWYFFWLTFSVALAIVPYMLKCKKNNLINSFIPASYWSDFKIVLIFSLSLFALSLFQVTAAQSMPILLSMFSINGAETVADFRIVEVIPSFIIMLCGSFTSIFLPKTSELMVNNNKDRIISFVEKWTTITTILVCILCFPLIISNKEIISAYVGSNYAYLGKWMALWCLFLIVQLHSTSAFSLILANGKTKALVWWTGIACLISMMVNAALCKVVPVGSAVIGYSIYMIILIFVYYLYFYKKYLSLNRWLLIKSFIRPVIPALMACVIPVIINWDVTIFASLIENERINYFLLFATNTLLWLLSYGILLKLFNILPSLKSIKG